MTLRDRGENFVDWFFEGGCLPYAIVLVLLLIGILGFAIVETSKAEDKWNSACVAQGGVVMTHSDTEPVTTISVNGQVGMGTTTSETAFCIKDGKILGIR